VRGAPGVRAGAAVSRVNSAAARLRARLPVPPPRVRRVMRRAFPGERRVWGSALLVLLITLPFLGYALLRQRPYYTSTDSIGLVGLYFQLSEHQQICVPQVEIGAGTGQVEWAYATATGPRPPISVTVSEGGRLLARGRIGQGGVAGLAFVSVPISPVIAPSPAFRLVSVCLRLGRGAPTQFGGMANTTSDQAPVTINGVSQGSNRVGVWFLPPAGRATRSLLAQWSGLMDKLAVFRPAFFGAWFYWLLFLLGLPLLSYFGLRLLAVAEEPRRRLVLGLALIAFAGNAAWAVTTAAFDSPDESEHYAYVESLAETGRAPISTFSATPSPYASDETLALAATRHFAQITGSFGHPPWAPLEYTRFRQELASQKPSRTDGGGFSVATSAHSPLYYSLLVPGYELGRSGGTFVELFWMRLTSALLGIIVPLCAFGVLRELAPSRRRLAVAGGLLVAFEPMFTFISGAVNNDVGVNAAAALAVYLAIRVLRRGLTWTTGIALGVTTAVLPLMKGTGYALYPAIALAVIAIAARIRTRRGLRDIAVGAAALVAVQIVWQSIAASFGRSAVTIPGGAGGGATAVTSGFASKLIYLWEVFFPRLPFMHPHWNPGQWPFFDIYIQRGIGGLGWYSIYFSTWVYDVVVWLVIAAGALALIAVWRRWPAVRARWRELTFLMLVIAGVIGGVEYEFYAVTPRPLLAEQGRYAFTALVPLAALAVAGLFALPRRWATAIATMAVTAMIVLAFASRILYLTFTYVTS
jgi:4-amino-4-deoxy-L-arabinose transferase-like glycosyltransferase